MASYPPHVIERSELRVLPAPNERYQLHVGLPPSYATDPARRYPVVYVSDGYWSFPMVAKMRDLLLYDGDVPEFIVVGLGYAGEGHNYDKLRWNELCPVAMPDAPDTSGRAADFLQIVVQAIIPLVDQHYRTDPRRRVLGGSSLGGLFTLYAIHAAPGVFSDFIAVTPAVVIGDDWLFGFEERVAAKGGALGGRLFLSIGDAEPADYQAAVRRFHARLLSRQHRQLDIRLSVIAEAGHCGGIFEGYVRGLRHVFPAQRTDQPAMR